MRKNFRLIISLLVVTVILFIVYNISQLEQEISENQYNNLIHDLSSISIDFSIWISNKKDILDTTKDVVDNFSYDVIVMHKTENPYLNINNDDPDISQIYIGLEDGSFLTGGQWTPPEDYDPTTRVWYLEAVEADETIVSKVYIDRETGKPLVTISSPLYIEDNFVGVISADVFLGNIDDYLQQQITDEDLYTYLVDRDGMVIIHTTRRNLEGKNLYTDIKDQILIDYFEEVKNTSGLVRMEYEFDNKEIKGIIQKIEGGEWYLTVSFENDNSLLQRGSINWQNLGVNIVGLSIMLILIYMILNMKRELDGMNKFLTHENEKDFLTGIYNRRYFNLYMDKLWKKSSPEQEVSLIFIDIDNFKEYNDTYGHIYGDEVIKKVTKCIGDHVRKVDVLARYGGEEFALVLDGTRKDIAKKISNTILAAIYDLNIEHSESEFGRITISVGVITVTPSSGISVRDTIDRVDIALYEAKDVGRNTVFIYNDIQ